MRIAEIRYRNNSCCHAHGEKFWVTKYSAKMGFCCISLCEIEIDCLIRVNGIYFSNNLSIHLKVSEIGSSF